MKAARNEPCVCGSGKKYKHCCLEKDKVAARVAAAALPAQEEALRPDALPLPLPPPKPVAKVLMGLVAGGVLVVGLAGYFKGIYGGIVAAAAWALVSAAIVILRDPPPPHEETPSGLRFGLAEPRRRGKRRR